MSDHGRKNWRGDRKSASEQARHKAALPAWKREKKNASATPRGWTWRRLVKLSAALSLLCGLVAVAIYLFWTEPTIHTHVVVITPLNGENRESGAAFFDWFKPPEIPAYEPSSREREYGKVTTESVNWLNEAADLSDESRKADALVIYLQARILAGTDDEFWCLMNNSESDLSDRSKYYKLSDLKTSIQQIEEHHPKIPVVLLVDQLAGWQDWRLGALKPQLEKEFETWTDDVPGLVIVSSSSGSEQSLSGRNGRTAFGVTVQRAFNPSADTNADKDQENGKVTVHEFCSFITAETDRWVRHHRHPNGQTVGIWPKDLQKSERGNKLVLRGSRKDDTSPFARNSGTPAKQLDSLWSRREKLARRLACRWAPLQWQTATEYLLRAQNARLDGHTQLADRLSKEAKAGLLKLEISTHANVPKPAKEQTLSDVLTTSTGMPTKWEASHSPEPERSGASTVLTMNLKEFSDRGFLQNKESLPSLEKLQERLSDDRFAAEEAAAQLMSLSFVLRPTILFEEQRLLSREDRIFSDPEFAENVATTTSTSLDVKRRWYAIRDFAQEHQQAELRFQDVVRRSRSLARWAGRSGVSLPEIWQESLQKTDRAPEFEVAHALPLEQKLKTAVLHLLISARLVGEHLYPVSENKNDGFNFEVTEKGKPQFWVNLQNRSEIVHRSLTVVQQTLSDMAESLSGAQQGHTRQVRQYRDIRELLQIADLTAGQRKKLIDRALKIDEELPSDAGPEKLAAPDSDTAPRPTPDNREQAWWQLQYLTLFLAAGPRHSPPEDSESDKAGDALQQTIDTVKQTEPNNPLSHQQLAQFGRAVRKFWQESRMHSKRAGILSGSTSEQSLAGLWRADLRCRGMSAWDAQQLSDVHPTAALHASWQTDLCRLQVERLKKGQWILPGDQQPWHENGWYGTEANRWISHARSVAESETLSKYNKALGTMPDLPDTRWSLFPVLKDANIINFGGAESSRKIDVTIGQHNGDDIPVGSPALLFRTGAGVDFTKVTPDIQSLAITGSQDKTQGTELTAKIEFQRIGEPESDGCQEDLWTSQVFYRGRWCEPQTVVVNPCPLPRFVATRQARPDTATVLLKGNDIRPIVFVLDMSGSMTRNVAGGETRKNKALEVLEDVIGNLPAETKVQLTAFGLQKEGGPNGRTSGDFSELGLGEPQDVNAYEDFVPLTDQLEHLGPREDKKSGRATIQAMLDKLKHVDPVGVTPLTYSISRAVTLLPRQGGLVVAITDGLAGDVGLDNRAGSDTLGKETSEYRAGDKTKDLTDALQKRPGSKVVVCPFELQDEEQEVLPTFNNALQRFVNPGQITVLQNVTADKLATKIKDALDPRNYTVNRSRENDSDEAAIGEEIEISRPKSDDDYSIRFGEGDLAPAEHVRLSRGDFLTLGVDWRGQQFRFDRWTGSSRAEPSTQPPAESKDAPDTLRCIDATRKDAGESDRIQLLLMLDHDDKNRPVQQPTEIEFRYFQPDSLVPHWQNDRREMFVARDWNEQPLGAPGYDIHVGGWPENRSISVEALWKMERTCPDAVLSYEDLRDEKFVLSMANEKLPAALVRVEVRADGILGVEVRPTADIPVPQNQLPALWNVRVEVGKNFILDQPCDFIPLELTTEIHRIDDGSVDFLFRRDFDDENVKSLVFAFTSEDSRRQDATTVRLENIDLHSVAPRDSAGD